MIFSIPSLFAVAVFAVASAGSIAAAPSSFDYPEVIPGPGMPGLASLGLTSEDLYEGIAPTPMGKRELVGRFYCGDHRCGYPPQGDAQACINYLRNLGTQPSGVPSGGIVICTAGQAVITGSTVTGISQTSSYCSDVATGGQHIIDNCNSGGFVGGEDVANGNGNLLIFISRC